MALSGETDRDCICQPPTCGGAGKGTSARRERRSEAKFEEAAAAGSGQPLVVSASLRVTELLGGDAIATLVSADVFSSTCDLIMRKRFSRNLVM